MFGRCFTFWFCSNVIGMRRLQGLQADHQEGGCQRKASSGCPWHGRIPFCSRRPEAVGTGEQFRIPQGANVPVADLRLILDYLSGGLGWGLVKRMVESGACPQ